MDEEREMRLRRIAYEFREMLARDEDNGGPLLGQKSFEDNKKLAAFQPRYKQISRKGVINRIRRHFWEVFTT